MPQESTAIEQAVSRAIRDNLDSIQRATDELNQAVNDVVAACASSKPANALPPMLRAQSTAASIAAALEVLSRFVAVTLQPAPRSPLEAEMTRLASGITGESARATPSAAPTPARERETGRATTRTEPNPAKTHEPARSETAPPINSSTSASIVAEPPQPQPELHKPEPEPYTAETIIPEAEPLPSQTGPFPEDADVAGETDFDVNHLSAEEQELHRRANRVAKVSMQDIKMLHPEQIRLGRENKDLCIRLRDDIEKAHREYDRRFRPIMDHPVDYFYRWMVEILADGDAHALGEYPYAVHANQR
jgi:hypothetical protein